MKPNLLIVQPQPFESDPAIERFCETLSETHYVYLIRPLPAFRDDSPAGVRYLNFSPDRLPGFGDVESVIVVGAPEIAGRLKEQYPAARHGHWNFESDGEFPFDLLPSLSDTIIQGDFGHTAAEEEEEEEPLARAM
jgi:hypothetical protein